MDTSTLLCRVCFALTLAVTAHTSAIPMWEFLSRGEKMSHLFNMFTKQVSSHCDTSTMPDCNKVLMVYGLSNLAKMGDERLDELDPYQRGAMDIIWDHMMGSDKHEDSHDSSDIYSASSASGDNHLASASSSVEQLAEPNGAFGPMMGPMVVRLLPDGRPVPGDAGRPLPRDEDADEYAAMRSRPVPSMGELLAGHHHSLPSTKAHHRHQPEATTTTSTTNEHRQYSQ